MQLVDSHCHLDDQQFDTDREAVIERARRAGLKWMLSIGTGEGPPDLEWAVRLADQYPFIWATVGVHPNDAPKADENTFRRLTELLSHPKVRAIGEIGLDYHWGVPKDAQTQVFIRQLEIAAEAKMPIVIHTRDAWEDTMELLRTKWAPTGLPCVMHCFTGTAEQANECVELGFYVAFGGVTTFPKAEEIREAAKVVPHSRLLLETDSPYLAPIPHRGKRNEPAFVAHTAEAIARVRGIDTEELAAQTTLNFERLFTIDTTSYTEGSQL
ncbi:MAG: TatD family hydrolase [Acidobacteriaceae bacterium]|nr:TatD family hydrolase [Acidobacteriaceae bacterium]